MDKSADYRSRVGRSRLGLWVAGVAFCLSMGAESASAGAVLCFTNWVTVSNQTLRCSDLAWVTTDNHGETVINLNQTKNGYYCQVAGKSDDPNAGELPLMYSNGAGLNSGTLDGAKLTEIALSCWEYDDGPAPPPGDPVPPVPPVDPS